MNKCKRVHHKKEPYDVFIARPSKWGSPFSYKENSTAPYKVATLYDVLLTLYEWLLNGEGQCSSKIPSKKGKLLLWRINSNYI